MSKYYWRRRPEFKDTLAATLRLELTPGEQGWLLAKLYEKGILTPADIEELFGDAVCTDEK